MKMTWEIAIALLVTVHHLAGAPNDFKKVYKHVFLTCLGISVLDRTSGHPESMWRTQAACKVRRQSRQDRA